MSTTIRLSSTILNFSQLKRFNFMLSVVLTCIESAKMKKLIARKVSLDQYTQIRLKDSIIHTSMSFSSLQCNKWTLMICNRLIWKKMI
jgi:hypothetical protein